MKVTPMVGAERVAFEAAGEAMWKAVADLVAANPGYADNTENEMATHVVAIAVQAIAVAATARLAENAPKALLRACGLVSGSVLQQAPSFAQQAGGIDLMMAYVKEGMRDVQVLMAQREMH